MARFDDVYIEQKLDSKHWQNIDFFSFNKRIFENKYQNIHAHVIKKCLNDIKIYPQTIAGVL